MKVALAAAGTIAAFLAIVVGLSFFGTGLDYIQTKIFSPKYEQVRHETFECSASHTDGLVRELRQIRDQWNHADAAGKAGLADTYKHDMDGYTCGDLPSDLQTFRSALQ
jgi:hypothetical protein